MAGSPPLKLSCSDRSPVRHLTLGAFPSTEPDTFSKQRIGGPAKDRNSIKVPHLGTTCHRRQVLAPRDSGPKSRTHIRRKYSRTLTLSRQGGRMSSEGRTDGMPVRCHTRRSLC